VSGGWRAALAAPPERLLGGLAIAAVPVGGLIVTAWYQAVAFDDQWAYRVAVWSVPLLVVAGLGLGLVALPVRRLRRTVPYLLGGFLIVWTVVLFAGQFAVAGGAVLACLPTTVLGALAIRRVERNRRLPWPLVIVALLWGACVASPFAVATEPLRDAVADTLVAPGRPFTYVDAVLTGGWEEAGKALGVLVLLVAYRHRINGALGGLVAGGLVGTGMQFAETVAYMTGQDRDTLVYQLWSRQYVSLLGSHAIYTGLAGAGLALAWQRRALGWRIASVIGGYAAAVAGHAVWNTAAGTGLMWHPGRAWLLLFVAQPVNVLLFGGPFLALFAVAGIVGLRAEMRGLVTELHREAATGLDAVRPVEVPLLASASARFRLAVRLLWYRRLRWLRRSRALQAAQLELAYARWYRASGEFRTPAGDEQRLRERVWRLRRAVLGMSA
jgi:RsiW-degrading membrane proteinase PrsW (M82 family)